MGKKKRNHPDVEEILNRPWCYYCERDFDDLKILINHQKAKHFKCERCGRRLNTAGGLNVHMTQVHKETLTQVENALPNRQGLDYEIFGMEGVPEDVMQSHQQRVLQQFYEQQAERRAATGNPPPGSTPTPGGQQPKKPKVETKEDLKARLAAHKAKKAQEAAGGSSGDVTPMGQGGQSPAVAQSPTAFPGAQQYPQQQMSFPSPTANPAQVAYAQPYGQPGYSPPQAYPPQSFPQQPGYGAQPFSPNASSPFPGQPFAQPGAQPFQPPFQTGPPRQPGSGSPPAAMPYGAHLPPSRTPPNNGHPPPRQGSLPAAPGLPQRPAFGAPQVNQYQLQQMHQGHVPPSVTGQHGHPASAQLNGHAAQASQGSIPGLEQSVDDLIASAGKPSEATKTADSERVRKEEEAPKAKKEVKLVYTDSEMSPEEKMAKLARYAFNPAERQQDEKVVGSLDPPVTGVVTGQDDVHDPSG
ncbi:c2h2 finger domain-containing protein [Diplodia corticola]|uniref:C2h2 finger domain-containing protein n=1 Tax=Diplodia corticola TaxID=236234 RepID=A0A1J9R946_9PEZI|nr:c2h2 finger domain-containing protein [Diplodia corticola]OJD36714.1 c2h2 finger domain-containing protein [Diplodia corticola]